MFNSTFLRMYCVYFVQFTTHTETTHISDILFIDINNKKCQYSQIKYQTLEIFHRIQTRLKKSMLTF